MKILHAVLALLVCLSALSCKKNDQILFTLDMEERIEVPGGLNNIETHIFSISNIQSLYQQKLTSLGLTDDDIENVSPGLASLSGVFNGINYANVDRVIVHIVDQNDPTNRREIFFQESISFLHDGPLELFGSLSDVKDIVSQNEYRIEVAFNFRNTTNSLDTHRFAYGFVAYAK